jgi:hypothetical protein
VIVETPAEMLAFIDAAIAHGLTPEGILDALDVEGLREAAIMTAGVTNDAGLLEFLRRREEKKP